jgi:hypothetical protein
MRRSSTRLVSDTYIFQVKVLHSILTACSVADMAILNLNFSSNDSSYVSNDSSINTSSNFSNQTSNNPSQKVGPVDLEPTILPCRKSNGHGILSRTFLAFRFDTACPYAMVYAAMTSSLASAFFSAPNLLYSSRAMVAAIIIAFPFCLFCITHKHLSASRLTSAIPRPSNSPLSTQFQTDYGTTSRNT